MRQLNFEHKQSQYCVSVNFRALFKRIFFIKLTKKKLQNRNQKMSLLPSNYSFLNDIYPKRFNQIGAFPGYLELTPIEQQLIRLLNPANYLRRNQIAKKSHIGKDGFEVKLNVEKFQPEEISVKTVDDQIIIEAKSERKSDNEYLSSEYRRRYELPSGFRAEDVISTISTDGVLTVKCARAPIDKSSVRQIEIQQTGPIKQQQNENGENKDSIKNIEESANRCSPF